MQTHGGTAAADAIESKERNFRIALYVDWTGTGDVMEPLADLSDFVDSIEVERALKGSAPEEILLIEGASAAELTVELSGEYKGMSLTQVFSRYNQFSPLYGKRTTGARIIWTIFVDTPIGNFPYQQFVGEIRTISPNRAGNFVTFTALDYVEKLRKPVILSPWAMSEIAVQWGEIDSQVCWSHSVIDLALRNCDVGPSPKRPTYRSEMNVPDNSFDGVQFFLAGNGSYLPTVGWLDNPNIDSFPNRGKAMYTENAKPHPDLPAGSPALMGFKGVGTANHGGSSPAKQNEEGYIRYWCADRDLILGGGTHWMGMTFNNPNQARAIVGDREIFQLMGAEARVYRIMIGGGFVWARRTNGVDNSSIDTAKVAIPTGTSPIDVLVQWDNTSQSGSRCYVKVGANDNGNFPITGSPVTAAYAKPVYDILGRVSVCNIVDLSDVFYSFRNIYNTSKGETLQAYRKPTHPAVLDKGLNRFSHIPSSKPQEAWKLITDVAAAEFGSVFWDEYGVFRFWNLETMLAKQATPVRRINLDQMPDINWTDTIDSVRNIFTIQASKKRSLYVNSIYTGNDLNEFVVPANTVKKFQLWVGDVLSPLTWRMGRYGQQENVAAMPKFVDGVHGYTVQGYFPAGSQYGEGWYENNLALTDPFVTVYFTTDGYLTVRVYNPNNMPIRLAKGLLNQPNTYGPQFNFQGTEIRAYADQTFVVKNNDSIDLYGPKTLELSGEWYQDTFAANNMVSTLMQRTAAPIPATDTIEIPGDPRLQLGDTVLLDDAEGFGGNIRAQLLGLRRRYSAEKGLRDVLTLEVLQPSGALIEVTPPAGTRVERHNLCTNPENLFNQNDWFGSSGSGRVAATNDFPQATTGFYTTGEAVLPRCPVTPGSNYTWSVWFMPNGSGQAKVSADWYINNEYYGTAGERTFMVQAGQLVRLEFSGSAPAGVDQAPLIVRTGTDSGQGISGVLSQVLYEKSLSAGDYFDGDTAPPGTSWDGTRGNSSSSWLITAGDDETGSGSTPTQPPATTTPDPGTGSGTATVIRKNLNANPAFGADIANYYGPAGVTLTRIPVSGMPRPYALSLPAMPGTDGLAGPTTEAMTPNTAYVFSAYIRNDGADTLSGQLQAHCKDATGGWLGDWGNAAFSIPPGETQRVSCLFTSPANTKNGNIYLYGTNRAIAITGFLYEAASQLGSYFDGETAQAVWDSTRYNSSSTLTIPGTGGGSTGGGSTGTAPVATSGTAAFAKNWGTPVAWDTFNYVGPPDPTKWSVYGEGGSEGGDGKQCWAGHSGNGRRCVEQVTVNGQYMRLAMLPNGDQSGVSHRRNQQYGKWEVRARTLPKSGSVGRPGHSVLIIWPESERWPEDGEYDFFECDVSVYNASANTNSANTTLAAYMHYPHDPGAVQQEYDAKTGVDLTAWHNYAFEWTPSALIGYIDGVQWFTRSNGATATRRNIQTMPGGHLTIQVDDFFPTGTAMQEGYLDVEWVRVYAP